eukprot:maker-scaffold770_size100439-snap-gene-0.24 protein:Tk05389 transcript:maker-scaffold770_size100439-snap-gene-0.24-mRNA-1 annotation:"PREDICTED: uncharacterized protein LOC100882003"
MYSVSQSPTKIVQKTRRGITQQLEQVDMLRDLTRKPSKRGSKSHKSKQISSGTESGAHHDPTGLPKDLHGPPLPVFHNVSHPLKKNLSKSVLEQLTPQHEEMIHFVNARWSDVEKEISLSSAQPEPSPTLARYYPEIEPSPALRMLSSSRKGGSNLPGWPHVLDLLKEQEILVVPLVLLSLLIDLSTRLPIALKCQLAPLRGARLPQAGRMIEVPLWPAARRRSFGPGNHALPPNAVVLFQDLPKQDPILAINLLLALLLHGAHCSLMLLSASSLVSVVPGQGRASTSLEHHLLDGI